MERFAIHGVVKSALQPDPAGNLTHIASLSKDARRSPRPAALQLWCDEWVRWQSMAQVTSLGANRYAQNAELAGH